jgi:Kre9/KNH-like N-terminal Ig-like domain
MLCQCSVVLTEKTSNNAIESPLTSNPINPCVSSITFYHPSAGTSWKAGTTIGINWTSHDTGPTVNIQLFENGVFQSVLTYSTPNINDVFNSYFWNIPINQAPSTKYKIQIEANNDTGNYVFSDSFTIHTGSWIIVSIPSSYSSWVAGSPYNIYWTSNDSGTVDIKLYKNGVYKEPIANAVTDTGVYMWTIPSTEAAGSDYQVRIVDHNDAGVIGDSQEFSITVPSSGIPGFAWEYAILALGLGIAIMLALMEKKHNLQIIAQ